MDISEEFVRLNSFGNRELEILHLISEGLSNREIAQRLFLSLDTVKWYNKQIFSKLGVSNRTQAVSVARQYSLLDISTNTQAKGEIPPHHNLPLQLTSFLGRKAELANVLQLLSPVTSQSRARLVTLSGPGGVGKTRLAIQAALNLVDEYLDGVWLVDFSPVSNPSLVPQTVASILGLKEERDNPILANLISHLQPRTVLLLLDNCEHLIDACAQLSATILQACPSVSILATSREPYGIVGELVIPVAPFSVPDSVHSSSLETLGEFDAMRLFIERARAVLPEFSLTTANSSAMVEVCHRLDGLPLAIELAAARIPVMTVNGIAERLNDSIHLLSHGSRTALPRAQTLQACMEWSYTLLSDQERVLLQRLAVFIGGWTLEAAEKICSGKQIKSSEVLNLLAQLVEKSLVVVNRRQSLGVRYRFLETIYQFVLEKLNSSGETAALKNKHLGYYLKMIESRETNPSDNERVDWLNRIEADHDNLRAALEWSLTDNVSSVICFRLARQLGEFWIWRGFLYEGRERFGKSLSKPGITEITLERAELLSLNAWLAIYQSDNKVGRQLLEQSQAIFEKFRPAGVRGEAGVLNALAAMEIDSGNAEIALEYAQKELEIAEEINYPSGIFAAHHKIGVALGHLNEYEAAWKHLEMSLSSIRGGSTHISLLQNMGELAVRQGDLEKGKRYLEECIRLAEEARDKWNMSTALGTLGWIALRQGGFAQAKRLWGESLGIRQDIGDKGGIAWCLEKLAGIGMLQGAPGKAARILGMAARLRLEVDSPVNSADKPDYDQLLASLRECMGEEKFKVAWEMGSAMTMDSAFQLALEI